MMIKLWISTQWYNDINDDDKDDTDESKRKR